MALGGWWSAREKLIGPVTWHGYQQKGLYSMGWKLEAVSIPASDVE
jgi:hypothetical protein